MTLEKAPRATATERHAIIVDEVLASGEADVKALAESLGVSQMTVRRDLRQLDEEGLIRRVHGGAAPSRIAPTLRSARMQREKTDIAARASTLIQPGSSVALDVGSTCTAVAHRLSKLKDLTVVTASVHAAMAFNASKTDVFLLGGKLTAEGAVIGSGLADEVPIALDTLVLGCGGLTAEQGATYHDWDETKIRRGLARQADTVILVADHSKFGQVRPYRIGALDLINVLVTDRAPEGELATRLEQANVEVCVA